MRKFEPLLVAVLCLAIGWFYLWTVRSGGDIRRFGQEQKDYYNLLIDGWLDGQLHLKTTVPEALLKLADPYDPKLRPPGLALHDATLYRGKYYIYFGVGPVVTLMLPFRLLTGIDLPLAVAVLVFVYGGFLASVALWLAIRRRYFPSSGVTTLMAGVVALGLASVAPLLLRRPHMWELPIGAAYCFTMLVLLCTFFSLHASRRIAWFAGAGLALGLAIASRPSFLLATPLLAIPLAWWWRDERQIPWRAALGAAAPLAVIGALMALHNYLRFDHPLQFGQAYQLSLDYEGKVTHFSPGYWAFNAWRYLFSAAQWSRYYPFIEPATLPAKPPGFSGHDDVFGVLVNLPLAWFALVAPLALWRRSSMERGRLGAWLGAATVLFVSMAALMLSFFGSLGRYLVDFTPAWMLIACVGILSAERFAQGWTSRVCRVGLWTTWTVAVAFSALFGALYTLQFARFLRERNPAKDLEVAKVLNHVPAWGERLLGVEHGPMILRVQLPRDRSGQTEPLLTLGGAGRTDRFFIRYLDEERIQLGFAHGSAREQLSRPLPAPRDRPHQVAIAAGALYPPETHPFFSRMSASAVAELRRRLRIEFNGETVLEGRQHFFESKSGSQAIGSTARDDPSAARFTGQVLSVTRRRGATDIAAATSGREHLRLRLRFNPGATVNRESLLRFSDAPPGAIELYVRQVGPEQVRFGLASPVLSGADTKESPAIALRPGVREVIVTLSSGRSGGSADRAADVSGELRVELDRVIVWSESFGLPPGALKTATLVGGAAESRDRRLLGEVYSAERFPEADDPLWKSSGALALRLKFPTDRTGRREPLLITGQTGEGNILCVEYVDDRTARLAFDFWSHPTAFSDPFRIDYAQPHDVEIAWGGFTVTAAGARRTAERRPLEVWVNGASVWKTSVWFHASEPEDLFIGREPLGGTSCDPEFTGEILSATRAERR